VQAVDEFAKQLYVSAKAWGDRIFPVNAESDASLISFHTNAILRNCSFFLCKHFSLHVC